MLLALRDNHACRRACGPNAGDPDKWAAMMDLNLNTPMRLTARFAPAMVNVST